MKKKTKQLHKEHVVALAGNPNVGKSTVFNALTGMNQHTGNWAGKTVSNARGHCETEKGSYLLVDLPGTYSLMAHSEEEECARNFICFDEPEAVIVVCDATCLERNLNLVLQAMEICSNVMVCVNLMDEAERKHIHIDLNLLSKRLGVPCVSTVARQKKSLVSLTKQLDEMIEKNNGHTVNITYSSQIERAVSKIEPCVEKIAGQRLNSRWISLKLLENDLPLLNEINRYLGIDLLGNRELCLCLDQARMELSTQEIDEDKIKDIIVSSIVNEAEHICKDAINHVTTKNLSLDRKIDRVLTSKRFGFPIMILLLAIVFWLTITGANYPSSLLSDGFNWGQGKLTELFHYLNAPEWLHGALVLGVYRVLAWVVSVMLPPMAIFFPLFTLLEDVGYLPRIAYNLDRPFKRCSACGKQALTMCMGFGCNACGVIGCRIIDSPRERLLAILTNVFVPCNGRFPTIIAMITMFFVGVSEGFGSSVYSAAVLTLIILLGIGVTFLTTKVLSHTILKGIPSSFTLELPPYRKPQLLKVIVRSVFDRTIFVLGRAVVVAAPAGLVIWLLGNIKIHDVSILSYISNFLDPFGKMIGLDGVILLAFVLGFPANEIVIPLIIMIYLAQGSLVDFESLESLRQLFVQHGWTINTAICVMIFSLMHWPCSTTLMTIKKETGSMKWTMMSVIIPTSLGILCCFLYTLIQKGIAYFI